MGFWTTLFLANIIFFLPYYFLNIKSQSNPFEFITSSSVSFGNKIKAIYYKVSSDPFKVFYEYTLLILIGQFLGLDSAFYSTLCTIVGLVGWTILIYSGTMKYIFQRSPIVRSDLEFFKVGWKMNYNNRYWIFLAIVVFSVLASWAIFSLSRHLLFAQTNMTAVTIVGLVLTILALVKVKRIKYDRFIHRTVLSVVAFSIRNFNYSNRFNYLFDKSRDYFESLNEYRDLELTEKPNLYIFSVESYGAVAFHDEEIKSGIIELCTRYNEQLTRRGYHIASALSTSPVSGGGSWKCYSSFTYGIKINDDLLYNTLFKSLPGFENYDSIFHTFKNQGYRNYLLCPATNYIEGTVDWDLVQRNMQSDEYLTWERIDYKGKQVPFLGNCYAPPDQYALEKAQQILNKEEDDPYVLFFSTLNSHYPFLSPTQTVDDIACLDEGDDFEILKRKQQQIRPRYTQAIRYQLETIFNFIDQQEDGIFVLFGDHQPPLISGKKDGFETPVHIIAKNKSLIDTFIQHGFEENIVPTNNSKTLKHEGFYSLFMKAIYTAYDKSKISNKAYRPNGIQLNK